MITEYVCYLKHWIQLVIIQILSLIALSGMALLVYSDQQVMIDSDSVAN